jgi:hypothetical protein
MGVAGLAPLAVTLSGTIANEHGAPVAHAFVRVTQNAELGTTYADAAGSYELRFSVRTAMPATVSFGAPGYEASLRELRLGWPEARVDAVLRPLVRVDAGASAHLDVAPSDGSCYPIMRTGGASDTTAWPCRLLRVYIPKTGVLQIGVIADDARDRFAVAFAVGSRPAAVFATECCSTEDSLRLPETAEALVQVVALELDPSSGARGRHGFTLQTALDPP